MNKAKFGKTGYIHTIQGVNYAIIDYRATYIHCIRDRKRINFNTPPNTWPQCIDMGIGHKGIKNYKKWRKRVAATALFQFHDEDNWLFYSPCNTTSLVLKIREKERYGESPQEVREGDKIQRSSLRFVSLHSKFFGLVTLF